MVHYLTPLGVEVLQAGSGPECLERVNSEAPDLILMDCQMPEMDGFETVTRLRSQGFQGTILALTAACDPASLDRCQQVGMNGHLGKPITPAALREAVAKYQGAPAPAVAPEEREEKPDDPLARARFIAKSTGNPAVLARLVAAFLKNTQDMVDQLQAAVAAGDQGATGALTHRLKGSAGTFGAERLSQVAARADDALQDGSLETAQSELQQIFAVWQQLKPQLESAGA